MKPDPLRPHNALPPLPPKADIESKAILKACIDARTALAELKGAGDLIPNQAVLINTIPILEAQASSEIENIVTTTDRLFRLANDPKGQTDLATKEALRYRVALNTGFQAIANRPITTALAVELCRIIKGVEIDIRATPGTALRNDVTGETIYTPPEGEKRLRDMLANWERFIHEAEDIDPLIRMAVMHYQFEAIHPFTDGNGRTGRVLNILYLVEKGLLSLPVLYLSRHIINHKADYYRLLRQVTEAQAWEAWILYMLTAVKQTAIWTTAKVRAIRDLVDRTAERMRREAEPAYSRELCDLIFSQPYVRVANVVEAGIAQRETASKRLRALVAAGFLEEMKVGRDKLFLNRPFLALLSGRD